MDFLTHPGYYAVWEMTEMAEKTRTTRKAREYVPPIDDGMLAHAICVTCGREDLAFALTDGRCYSCDGTLDMGRRTA